MRKTNSVNQSIISTFIMLNILTVNTIFSHKDKLLENI